MFEAVILAGGKGTRLKEITGNVPKTMVEINGVPFLYILMKRLEYYQCSRIILSLGYNADYIIKAISRDKPVKCEVCFVVEDRPLGTGGAIKNASKLAKNQKIMVMNGDSYNDINLYSVYSRAQKYDFVLCGVNVENIARFGSLKLNKDSELVSFNEKKYTGPGIINSGIYIINKNKILKYEKNEFSFEKEFIPLQKDKFKVFVSKEYFIDIGVPVDYAKACEYFS